MTRDDRFLKTSSQMKTVWQAASSLHKHFSISQWLLSRVKLSSQPHKSKLASINHWDSGESEIALGVGLRFQESTKTTLNIKKTFWDLELNWYLLAFLLYFFSIENKAFLSL